MTKLSPQEAKALEMLNNGFSRADICDEMVITNQHLSTLFNQARRKGVAIPKGRPPGNSRPGKVPIQRLMEIYESLEKRGFKGAGLYRVMSERTGISINCLRVRIWRYKNGRAPLYARQGEQAA